MDGREPYGARQMIGQKKARRNALLVEPSGQPLHGRPRETGHENVVRRDPTFEAYLDPRLGELAGHGQRRMAVNLRGWPASQSLVWRHVVIRPGARHARA